MELEENSWDAITFVHCSSTEFDERTLRSALRLAASPVAAYTSNIHVVSIILRSFSHANKSTSSVSDHLVLWIYYPGSILCFSKLSCAPHVVPHIAMLLWSSSILSVLWPDKIRQFICYLMCHGSMHVLCKKVNFGEEYRQNDQVRSVIGRIKNCCCKGLPSEFVRSKQLDHLKTIPPCRWEVKLSFAY